MISIVIPLYNKGSTIRKTLNSVLLQSFREFEVIIVNDGSTDDSLEQIGNDGSTDDSLEQIGKVKGDRVRVVHQQNRGVSAARNRGIREARYDYIAFLDADDLWEKDCLETLVDLIVNYQDCSVFAVGHKIIDHRGKYHNIILRGLGRNFCKGEIKNYFEIVNKSNGLLCSSSVVVRRDALEAVGGFLEGVRLGEDLLTWTKLALRYKIAYTKAIKVYFVYLVNKNGKFCREPDSNDVIFLELKRLLDEEEHPELRRFIAKWCERRFCVYLKKRKIELAKREFEKMRPYSKKGLKLFIYWILVHFSFCIGLAYRMNKGRRAIIKWLYFFM